MKRFASFVANVCAVVMALCYFVAAVGGVAVFAYTGDGLAGITFGLCTLIIGVAHAFLGAMAFEASQS